MKNRMLPEKALMIMAMLPKGGIGVEIGAHRGRFTQALHEHTAPQSFTLVDAWENVPENTGRAMAFEATADKHAEAESRVREIAQALQNTTVLKQDAQTFIEGLQDRSLDWAWFDCTKHYDLLLAKLEALLPKLKEGGTLAGGGYFWGKVLGHPVRAALKEFVARINGAKLAQRGQFWAITLPDTIQYVHPQKTESFLVVSTMKNEAPFIVEWVAHYRSIGFTDFLVFTNDCEDTTDPLLDRIGSMGGLTHQINEVLKRGPHKSALKYAKDHVLTQKADWILICDVDEFLSLKRGDGSIQGFLEEMGSQTDIVPFPWKTFGNGGVLHFEDKLITAQFTKSETAHDRDSREVKTIFRNPRHMYHWGLHRPRVAPEHRETTVWKSPSGKDISEQMNIDPTMMLDWEGCEPSAYMHHYPLRSVEAYILKKNRGRANHFREDLGHDYWRKWNYNTADDHGLTQKTPAFEREHQRLMQDPEVKQLHDEGVAWHKAQFERLMQDQAYKDLFEELSGAKPMPKLRKPMASKRESVRREMLATLPKGSVGAEIGVWEGKFSATILEVVQPQKLHLIDPWTYDPSYPNCGFGRARNRGKMEPMFEEVSSRYEQNPHVEIHRAKSAEVLPAMDQHSLDWVYIDGNHNAPFVEHDLEMALRVVKRSGYITGDDYYWRPEIGAPVKSAVETFMQRMGESASLTLQGQQFIIKLHAPCDIAATGSCDV